MADVALVAGGTEPAPLAYTIPGAQEIVPKSITASFDGSGAGGPFVPTLKIIAPNGAVLARCPASAQVAAGASADVSWFPRGGVGSGAAASGIQFDTDNEGGWLYTTTNALGPLDPFTGLNFGTLIDDTTGEVGIRSRFAGNEGAFFIDEAKDVSILGSRQVFIEAIGGPDLTVSRFVGIQVDLDLNNPLVVTTPFHSAPNGAFVIRSATGVGLTDRIGFFNAAPVVRPNVVGSRGGNAALASLLTGLANLGLITNSTTP